uniref:Uncharacterized protein n=1 Tax=Vitis vinifera TaxID=29760 RepID=F6HLK9_VITVI
MGETQEFSFSNQLVRVFIEDADLKSSLHPFHYASSPLLSVCISQCNL